MATNTKSGRDLARIAFVGAGGHSSQSLYPNIPLIPEFELVAVCDLDGEKARQRAADYGAAGVFTDVEAMLDGVKPDGVCICGSPAMNHEVSLQVLTRGIPIFVEKPPAEDTQGAAELVEASKEAGTWGMVGFMKRFAPANRIVRGFMNSPEFGQFTSLTAIHGCGHHESVRNVLIFNAIHIIDLARFFAGEVKALQAYVCEPGPTRKAICANFRFQSGGLGQLNVNSGHTWQNIFEQVYLSGQECGIVIDQSNSARITSPEAQFVSGQDQELFAWGRSYSVPGAMSGWSAGGHYTRGYWGELSHFARSVLGKVPPVATLEDGLAAMRIIDAITESAATGAEVEVKAGVDVG